MNVWAAMLADTPPTLQRLIARTHRVSLPRGCDTATRHARLRQALCRAAAVRATFFTLPPDARAALQVLRLRRGGISPSDLVARYGGVRPWSEIAVDPRPHTLSEHLILLGWLLPRPATPRHPARFLLPPELRTWLPAPLDVQDDGPAPPAPPPPALRAAAALLLACAERPLPLRADGTLRVTSLRRLAPRLAPLDTASSSALCRFLMPLLADLGLLAPHQDTAALAPAGHAFLALPPSAQLERLRAAWVRVPRPDAWLRPLLADLRGIDWPLLRRRLLAWAAVLPEGRLYDPASLYPALAASLGPLADAQSHGLRAVDRAPWQSRRAAEIWQAALRGPLAWLGYVTWANITGAASHCFATGAAHTSPDPDAYAAPPRHTPVQGRCGPRWRYGDLGELLIPHTALDDDALTLLRYARWQAADDTTTTYRLSRRSIAAAQRDGYSASALRVLLEGRAGSLPPAWDALLGTPVSAVRVIHTAVVLSDEPGVLERAARQRTMRRYLGTPLAPGIALVEPQRVAALVRSLEAQNLAVEVHGAPSAVPPAAFTPAECATLLALCAAYHGRATGDVPLPALASLEARLRAALPAALRDAEPPVSAPAPHAASGSPEMPRVPSLANTTFAVSAVSATCPPDSEARPTARAWLPPRVARALARGFALALWWLVGALLLVTHRAPTGPHPSAPARAAAGAEEDRIRAYEYLPQLRRAIARRRMVRIRYRGAGRDTAEDRTIRPLRLEGHGERWYLSAYCALARAERTFRVDRIESLAVVEPGSRRREGGLPRPAPAVAPRRARGGRAGARAGSGSFFPPSPPAAAHNPLARVWLDEEGRR
ncbi:MAG TPA: WYL domain-containing protein [Roseiflexaceae bacterium]|nr:WYL domain-containing protein [Roseiflexaceae bacterium]